MFSEWLDGDVENQDEKTKDIFYKIRETGMGSCAPRVVRNFFEDNGNSNFYDYNRALFRDQYEDYTKDMNPKP